MTAEAAKKGLREKANAFNVPEPNDPSELITIRLKGGKIIQIQRGELVRRAMAVQVANKIQDLVQNHHINENGRPIKLDPQWKQIYADPAPDMRIIAGAQKGKTLYQMIKAFAQLLLGMSVGWVMPKEGKIHELVNGKLNPTIKNTALYREMHTMSGGNDTMKFKTFGEYGKLYMVTANSQNELTSFSADCMHIDERDFCNKQNIPMYPSRMNFSPYKLTNEISTPTVEGTKVRVGQIGEDNIHSEFLNGDQHRWHSLCPHCGEWQILDWFDNIVNVQHDESGRITTFGVRDPDWTHGTVEDLRTCCSKCDQPFHRGGEGRWIALNPGAKIRTYWVESLATMVGPTMAELLEMFRKALGNPTMMQHFYNMMLGRPYAGGHMRFTEELFEHCVGTHDMLQRCEGPCTIGIDVNRPWLDIQISVWRDRKQYKVWAGKIQGGEPEVIDMIKRFNCVGGVIDTHPETKFACSLQEKVFEETGCRIIRCKYATGEQANPIVISMAGELKIDPPRLITVDRTCAVDMLYGAMQTRKVEWFRGWRGAADGALIDEFTNPVRRLVVNDAGNERFSWVGKPDHSLHAAVYDQLAGEIMEMAVESDLSEIGPFITEIMHTSESAAPTGNMPTRDDVVMFFG